MVYGATGTTTTVGTVDGMFDDPIITTELCPGIVKITEEGTDDGTHSAGT